jgi:hypothetical protein
VGVVVAALLSQPASVSSVAMAIMVVIVVVVVVVVMVAVLPSLETWTVSPAVLLAQPGGIFSPKRPARPN